MQRSQQSRRLFCLAQVAAFWFVLLTAARAEQASIPETSGKAIYESQCVDCHGPEGQGTDYYSIPLVGDLPVVELARLISDTMPEGDPEACIDAEALAVAEHLHKAFYSPLAQARIRPPRRELSRLTVRQLEQSLVDLLGEFSWQRQFGEQRGLTASFQRKVNTTNTGEPVELILPRMELKLSEFDRLPSEFRDPTLEGEEQFGNKRIDVHIDVHGGIWAPTTGIYEFYVRTPNAVRLTVNDQRIIDAKIRSDSEPEVRGSLRLVGGRTYPIIVYTSRVSEEDIDFTLGWRRPGGIDEVVATRFLSPHWYPTVNATSFGFPPDDRSVGYVRGAAISPEWWDATTRAALETAERIVSQLHVYTDIEEGEELSRIEAIRFCERVAEVGFRRPLSDSERELCVERHFANQNLELPESIEHSLVAILTNPRLLYPQLATRTAEVGVSEDYAVASRLALALWDSIPDRTLKDQAERGWLNDRESVRLQARRMLDDERARSKLAEFFEHWLRLDHVSRLTRDPERFPDFDDRVAADMRTSLEMMLEEVVWRGDGDLRHLFLTKDLYVNQRLADFLGIKIDVGDDPERFIKAPVDTHSRAGIVSHPYMVTALSYYRDTSPIHRGVFLARHVLGRSLRPPPEAVAPLAPELAPDLTTRERVALQTSPGACQGCHVLINDLGFTLEEFDAVGRFRDRDTGKPVDPSGGYVATDGRRTDFRGARELAEFLADEEDVHQSFVVQLFEHLTKQPMLAYGVETRESLQRSFRESGYNIRELLIEAATVAALDE